MVSVNKDSSEFALAVANLAAAAIAANPSLTMQDAVRAARESLRGATASAQQIAASVRADVMLRRYVKRKFNMTPDEYRKKWCLPDDYPFVAPNYSMRRSKIAKKMGLGKK